MLLPHLTLLPSLHPVNGTPSYLTQSFLTSSRSMGIGDGQPALSFLWDSFLHLRGPSQWGIVQGPAAPACSWGLVLAPGTHSPVASPALRKDSLGSARALRAGTWVFLCLFLLFLPLLPFVPPAREAPSHSPLCPSSPRCPWRCALARGLAHQDFHQDGVLGELRGGDTVPEVFWA